MFLSNIEISIVFKHTLSSLWIYVLHRVHICWKYYYYCVSRESQTPPIQGLRGAYGFRYLRVEYIPFHKKKRKDSRLQTLLKRFFEYLCRHGLVHQMSKSLCGHIWVHWWPVDVYLQVIFVKVFPGLKIDPESRPIDRSRTNFDLYTF